MRQVLTTNKKSDHWPPKLRHVIAHCSAQHRISTFERIEHRALSHRSGNLEFHFTVNARQRAQVRRQHDAYHRKNPNCPNSKLQGNLKSQNLIPAAKKKRASWDLIIGTYLGFEACDLGIAQVSVCTSTDRTAGRSRTIEAQLSPPSADA